MGMGGAGTGVALETADVALMGDDLRTLPFAVGLRACIAAPLAMMQIHIAVAMLAQRFRFRLVAGHPIEPVGWTTLRPGRGIRVTVEQR